MQCSQSSVLMKLLLILLSLLIDTQGIFAVETKWYSSVLSAVAAKMPTNWRSFCITALVDNQVIIESQQAKMDHDDQVPITFLQFDTDEDAMREAQLACPNLIIGKNIDYNL